MNTPHTLPPRLSRQFRAIHWAIGEGMDYWPDTVSPHEAIAVPMLHMIQAYSARVSNRNAYRAMAGRRRLWAYERFEVGYTVIAEFLPVLCPVLLPEDRAGVVLVLAQMLMRAGEGEEIVGVGCRLN